MIFSLGLCVLVAMEIERTGGIMKYFKFVLVMTGCLILFSPVCNADDDVKIGVIDFQQVLNQSRTGKSVQEAINKKGQAFKAEIEKAQADIKAFQDKARREAPLLDDDQKKEIERQMRGKLNGFRSLQEKHTNEFNAFKNEQIGKVKNNVIKLAAKIGQKEDYLVILEKLSGAVLYTKESSKLTDQFVQEIDKAAP
jgi:outer membrane protein